MFSGHIGEVQGRDRSNTAAKCARKNVLQDKDTIFVNTTYTDDLMPAGQFSSTVLPTKISQNGNPLDLNATRLWASTVTGSAFLN